MLAGNRLRNKGNTLENGDPSPRLRLAEPRTSKASLSTNEIRDHATLRRLALSGCATLSRRCWVHRCRVPGACRGHQTDKEERHVQASAPTGYLEIERALRLLALGDSDLWIARKLHDVDHPAAARAVTLLRQGRRRQAQAMPKAALAQLAGASNGNGLAWFSRAGL